MRRQSTEQRSQGTRIRSRDEARGALSKRSRLRRLALEPLEARTLLATTPIPVVTNQVTASSTVAGNAINDSSPSIAVDPTDPSKLAAIFTVRDTSSGTTLFYTRVTFSTDGGTTWNLAPTQPNLSFDPTSTTGARLQDTAEGIGFDRNHNFYVGILETNNSNAGDVVVDKYNFSSTSPTAIVIGSWGNQTVYSWDQAATNASAQPTVLNFSMAVDDNVSSYQDPATGATQSDPNSGAVYLAWTLNTPPPQGATNWNPFTIQAVASADGVTWPATGLTGVTGPAETHLGAGNFGGQRYTDPQITVSQGKAGGSDGGQISVVWDDYTSGNNDTPPDDFIFFSALNFKLAGGAFALSTSNPGGSIIARPTVRGAQTGTNFPLATPSSPTGIGPAPVLAVDNTLGSFSAHEGRIYMAFVDRSTATGNPPDNTNIELIFSDNDGVTWSGPTIVNNDSGATDGHTAGDGGLQGRPQYQPSIAVDNSTGTLVLSWLDVRDDASLQRYADYITYSLNGGASFSPQTFADLPNVVTDATTGSTFVAGPYSGNESGGNPNSETTTAFGQHQGLAVSNGVIHPIWATTGQNIGGNARLTITTARATMPAGPRIISGTSGSLGTTSFNTITVTFDRPIAVNSFNNPNQVLVQFLNAVTDTTSNVAVASITPVATQGALGLEATQFTITLTQAQTGVGTYSYAVRPTVLSTPTSQFPTGTAIQDLFQTAGPTSIVFDPGGTASITPAPPTNIPGTITDAPASTSTTTSSITVSGVALGNFLQHIQVNIAGISYPNDANLTIQLTSPDGITVTLASGLAGANFSNTAFSDTAAQPITAGTAPYTGLWKPAQSLDALTTATPPGFGNGSIDGKWTLSIIDKGNSGFVGQLTGWSMTITPQTPATVTMGNPTPAAPLIIDPAPATSTTASTIAISGAPPADVAQAVSVTNLTINYPSPPSPLTVELTSPGGQTVVLATGVGALSNATLSTNAFTGSVINGNWMLTIIDANNGGLVGSLQNWSLHINAGSLVSSTASTGNKMDQNANGIPGQAIDYFANPMPTTPTTNPFAGPYDTTTLPIVIGGPRVVSSFVPGGVSDPTGSAQPGNNLVLNGTVGSIDVTFNQAMDPSTFTAGQVLLMTGPTGPIVGPFTVVPDPQAGENPSFPKTFKISFPTQQLSGTYNLTLGAGIKSQTGIAVDTNQNAGVSLLFTNATATVPQGPATFTSAQAAAILPGTPAAPSSVSTSITVPANDISLIQDFSLQLNINYPNDPDLTATLTTPIIDPVTHLPFTVLLFGGNGSASGSQANFTNTVFQDSAQTLIGNGAPPFLGQFKPLQSLLVDGHLLGQSEAGTYTLTITNAGSGTGTLTGWSITATPKTTTNTGLGEPVADQTAASFRIFTMDPTNPLSSNTWTAVGPASNNNGGNSGRVSAIAVDASDPSGNTVYVAGASGGVWKTTDFLTTKSGGPTYTLLTGNAEGNALNIGSIAVFSRNNDPNQSIIVAGTGEGNTAQPGVQGSSTVGTSAGVGFLISYDGGKTWTLDDSLVNYNAQGQELPEAQRGHEFVGTSTYKVIIDPKPTPNGNIIIYAALGGGQAAGVGQGGLYRSIDSGHTWQLMRAGFATDVVFDPNSGTVNAVNTSGNLLTLYAAFLGEGVFLSPTQGQTWNPMTGGVGDPLVQNFFQGKLTPVPVTAPGATPTGAAGRIVLAKPALTGNALLDAEFETWLYAAVVNPDGSFKGLFITKDNGANWTDALLPNALAATATTAQGADPSNNIGQTNYNITGGQGNYDFALAVDPTNPNITYIGGSADFGPTTMIRVDITRLSDPYSLYTSTETLGGQILKNTTSPVTIKDPTNLLLAGLDPLSNPFTNVYRNPVNVFNSSSTVEVFDTGSFANDGSGAWWTPFDGFIGGTDVHTIIPMVDPATGKTRLLVGYDQGIATGIDNNGTLLSSIGNQSLASGVRNGNIQITQFYNGAAQPSALAAQIAGALFYGEAQDDGFPESNPNVLTNGNIGWVGSTGDGTDVVTDATGSGTNYQSTWPCCNTSGPDNFFQVNGIGRTFGLLQSTSVPPGPSLPGTPDPQWPYGPSFNFAVNPVNNQEMIIGSGAGRLFETQDEGVIWTELAEPTVFDSTTIPALAYGAPDPGAPLNGALGNYMLIGTTGGHIYVTFTGGGGAGGNAWTNMTPNGLGAPVERIVTDPTRGTHDAYAITTNGVYYNANTQAAGSTWVNITGDLFAQTTTPFGDANLTTQALLNLGGLAVDWRYVIPFDPTNPSKGTHPMLYVAGVGGVFRSTNNGTNWTAFPDQTLATPVPEGNLPSATISDLDMVLGNVDPTTGHPNVSTGPNLLLATTYGSGSYGIRLAPIIFNDSTNKVTESQNTTTGVLTFKGLSEQSAFGTAVAVTVEDVTDPNNPIFLGGYNPADGLPSGSATFNNTANQTDVNGKFSVSGSYPAPPAGNPFFFDGSRKIAVFATDASGTKGNVVSFQITNSLPAPTSAPVFVNAASPPTPLTNGVVSGGTIVTTSATTSTQPSPALTFQFTVPNPGPGQTIGVTLIRVDSQQNSVPVRTISLNGTNSGSPLAGTIQDPGPVPVGTYTYEFQYSVTVAGQPTTSPLSPTTAVQVVAPMAAPNLYFLDDSGVAGDGITNVKQPRFTGTAIPNAANDQNLKLRLVETAYTSTVGGVPVALPTPLVLNNPLSVDPVNGQYLLQPATALADGTYSLAVVAVDAAGDTIASSPLTLTISTQGPQITPTIALLPASHVPNNPSTPNATVARRPIIFGNTDPGAVVTITGSVNGGAPITLATTTAQALPNNGHPAGYYQVQLPSNLNDGTVTLFAKATNAAGNPGMGQGTFTLQITSVAGDYTGVGAAGASIYSPSTGNYTFEHAVTGGLTIVYGFGQPNVDIPVPGDYNGDGQTDPAIYRPTNGYWAIDVNSQAGGQYIQYIPPMFTPGPNVIPAPADFDTDGQADPAIFTPVSGFGYFVILHNVISSTSNTSVQVIAWGLAGDTPVSGDYDGAGSAQVAVYRPSTGAWYVRSSGVGEGAATPAGKQEAPVFVTAFQAGDMPVQANYDGLAATVGGVPVGVLQEAIYRPSTETFYIYNPNTKATRQVTMPKLAGQGPNDVIIPASADYSGDGRADAAIFDQTLGTFEFINSATNQVVTHHFTLTGGDIPLAAPEGYRAAAYAAGGAQAALRQAGAFFATAAAPASSPGSATPAAVAAGSNSAASAVVVGATVPTGLTSTGKANTLPPIPVPSPAPVTVITSGSSINRPAQDTTDSAIDSLGKSYNGTFI
jgi:subtilisin-like proprotein convertase family protein